MPRSVAARFRIREVLYDLLYFPPLWKGSASIRVFSTHDREENLGRQNFGWRDCQNIF
jgi:hypothetical protein